MFFLLMIIKITIVSVKNVISLTFSSSVLVMYPGIK